MYGKVFGQAQRTDIKQKLSATYNITTRHALLVSPVGFKTFFSNCGADQEQ